MFTEKISYFSTLYSAVDSATYSDDFSHDTLMKYQHRPKAFGRALFLFSIESGAAIQTWQIKSVFQSLHLLDGGLITEFIWCHNQKRLNKNSL